MYSTTIKEKIDRIFQGLREKALTTMQNAISPEIAAEQATQLVHSELSARSQAILSDMLFDLSDQLMKTEFFSDLGRQNWFLAMDLRQEILEKYSFSPDSIAYKPVSRTAQALRAGGATLAIGGAVGAGAALVSGMSLSRLVPLPLGLLIAASVGVALADYYKIAPEQNQKKLIHAVDVYLTQTEQQLLAWFDNAEAYFNQRVEEIKKTLEEES